MYILIAVTLHFLEGTLIRVKYSSKIKKTFRNNLSVFVAGALLCQEFFLNLYTGNNERLFLVYLFSNVTNNLKLYSHNNSTGDKPDNLIGGMHND